MQLKSQLQNLPKANLSITEYFEKKRAIAGSLAESLYFVQDDDFISFVLNGLDSSFSIFKAAFNMHSGPITPEELFGLLLQEEEHLAEELRSTTVNTHFGSDPSHALLTHSSSYPTSPLNTNQSSILGPPSFSNRLAHNPHNHAHIPHSLGPIIVSPSVVCNVKYVAKIIMMLVTAKIVPTKKLFHQQGSHHLGQLLNKHILLLLQLLLILLGTSILVLHIM